MTTRADTSPGADVLAWQMQDARAELRELDRRVAGVEALVWKVVGGAIAGSFFGGALIAGIVAQWVGGG